MNFKFLLPLAALAVLATACGEEFKFGGDSPSSIELGTDALDFSAEGGDAKLAVFSQGSWKAETAFDWISAERAGDSLQVSVDPNPDIYWRSGNVKVSSGNTELLVEVHQDALGLAFSLATNKLELDCEAVDSTVAIQSNVEFTVQAPEWLNATVSEAGLSISLERNYSLEARGSEVYFIHGEEIIGSLSVSQAALVPEMSFGRSLSEGVSKTSDAFTDTLSLSANWAWSLSCEADWLTISAPQAGEDGLIPAGDYVLDLSGTSTRWDRNTNIVFSCGGKTYSMPVAQDGIPVELSLDKSSVSAKSRKDTVSFTVTASEDWSLSDIPTWITADKTSGNAGSTLVTLYVEANPGTDRSATLKVTCYTKTANITVNQASAAMSVKIVFGDGSSVFRAVLTPSLGSSIGNCYNLGPVERKLTADQGYVMEFYSSGATLCSTAAAGLRVTLDPKTYSTTNQLRNERFAYVKFPGIEGKKLISIKVKCVRADTEVYVGTACGPTNAAAIASSVTDTSPNLAVGDNTFTIKNPQANTPYYLLMFKDNWEYRLLEFTIDYVSAE